MCSVYIYAYVDYFGALTIKNIIFIFLFTAFSLYFAYTLSWSVYYKDFYFSLGYSYFEIFFKLPILLGAELEDFLFSYFFQLFIIVLFNYSKLIKLYNANQNNEINKKNFFYIKRYVFTILMAIFSIGVFFYETKNINIFVDNINELSVLRRNDKDSYKLALSTLASNSKNSYFESDNYYAKGTSNTIHIKTNFPEEFYLSYEIKMNNTNIECAWGDWYNDNKDIDLNVFVDRYGCGVVEITNSFNDDSLFIFVENVIDAK